MARNSTDATFFLRKNSLAQTWPILRGIGANMGNRMFGGKPLYYYYYSRQFSPKCWAKRGAHRGFGLNFLWQIFGRAPRVKKSSAVRKHMENYQNTIVS